ncbi:SAF domain-containing protein [Arthrobacter sp. PAMC 25486]|uniref:RcpC/CpaB family pilus assembly protein n=1 Tax=Arthrobacter sp. PAMC 25486 TaxID=1494608 RepID=UPI0020A6C806|nr:SAF domain-containing protein [Arthrobacter sp. PAMC 25486]
MKTRAATQGPPSYPGPAWRSQLWPGGSPPTTPMQKLSRWTARHRRFLAALLLCLAAAIAVQQLTPASPPTTTVMVAARDLPAGHPLGQGDVLATSVSPRMVPDGVLVQAATWNGRQLSGPLRRGEVLTDASLLGSGLLIGAASGSQAVPIRLSDPSTLALLRQGQLVSVVLSTSLGLDGPTTNEVLAENVPVLWTPALAQSGGLLPAQENEGILVVAATPAQAVQLAGAISRGKVFLILLN